MTVIEHDLTASCGRERIWKVLADLTAVQSYNPTVKAARVASSDAVGVGALRECDLEPKGRLLERVTVWDEGRALGLEIVESDWPVRSMNWITKLEDRGSGSRLTQRLEYRMKFGVLGWLLDRLVMQRNVTTNVEATLRRLIKTAEDAPA